MIRAAGAVLWRRAAGDGVEVARVLTYERDREVVGRFLDRWQRGAVSTWHLGRRADSSGRPRSSGDRRPGRGYGARDGR